MTSTDTAVQETDPLHQSGLIEVAHLAQLPVDRGVAVLVAFPDGDVPVALFRLGAIGSEGAEDREEFEVFAVGHLDPVNGAPVMARGLIGSLERDDDVILTVASPLLKQRYDLRTGACLDNDELSLPTYPITVRDGRVFLEVKPGKET